MKYPKTTGIRLKRIEYPHNTDDSDRVKKVKKLYKIKGNNPPPQYSFNASAPFAKTIPNIIRTTIIIYVYVVKYVLIIRDKIGIMIYRIERVYIIFQIKLFNLLFISPNLF